ncbi:MAG: aminotransferase class I/II-fold pyridoxal phosphate-dependent enzyme, partial [Sulfurospirillaceae bacterium]|nr:aminotransferase class I/II-fold pyridoxal phosphate-dependent enzyme [Sulfurospirillaceae bacterium]
LFGITPKENHIKMGTLGKALGSYGAYILCSAHICEFLENRAKAIIYTTAPSLFDIALGYQGLLYILKHKTLLHTQIIQKQRIVEEKLALKMHGLIGAYPIRASLDVLILQKQLIDKGFLVGAIRPPTVPNAILRIIPRICESDANLELLCDSIKELSL